MITKVLARAQSAISPLAYNFKKVKAGQADIIMTNKIPQNLNISHREAAKLMREWEKRSRRMGKTAFHLAVNQSREEYERMGENNVTLYIKELMSELGYSKQPYIVFKHHDIDRVHYHVVSVRTDWEGRGIPTHNEGRRIKRFSVANANRFCFHYGKNPREKAITVPLKRFDKSKGNVKQQIQNLIEYALDEYFFSNLAQFSKVLKCYHMNLEWKMKYGEVTMFCKGLDENDTANTRAVALSEDLRKSILSKFDSYERPSPSRAALVSRIIANVFEHSSNENDFHSQLGNYGLRIFLDRTRDGNSIFGTTVVDMINHQAFKGSDLDKRLNNDIKDAFAVKGAERIYNPIFDSSSQARMIADEFALKAGIGVMNNEGVWGIRVRDDAVFLTYSGDDYCGITLSDNEMTCCSKSAVDFVRKYFGQVWNVSSFLDKVRPIILSTSNIERAQKPVGEAQENKQSQSSEQSKGIHR